MPIKIYHAAPSDPSDHLRRFSGRPEDLDEERLQLVAHMRTGSLEEAFAQSQHLDRPHGPWHEHPEQVLFLHPGPYPAGPLPSATPRSTAVGDVLEDCESFARFLVADVGVVPLPPRPAPALRFPLHPTEWRRMLVQVWDVALAWRLITLRASQEPDGMANLGAYAREDLASWLGVDVNRAMSDETDLRVPILIVPVSAPVAEPASARANEGGEAGTEYTPIDGHHRIYKALTEGRQRLPVYRLTPLEGAIVDDTAARFGNRTRATRYHMCGQRLTRYTQARGGQRFTWFADETTPLLTHCPRCGKPLTPGTVRAHPPHRPSVPGSK